MNLILGIRSSPIDKNYTGIYVYLSKEDVTSNCLGGVNKEEHTRQYIIELLPDVIDRSFLSFPNITFDNNYNSTINIA